jgi:diaminohydroxyphosphoribosylaminopyrimidine deaminase / 5-amino-6-(5-phosphoribosylamino)uracil reductase
MSKFNTLSLQQIFLSPQVLSLSKKAESFDQKKQVLPQNSRHFLAFSLALKKAFSGLGFSSPNPSVGCVILNNKGCIIATGYHKKVGEPHGEIEALKALAPVTQNQEGHWVLTPDHFDLLKDASIYVTLEPCAHRGRTPSCAELLSQLPLKKVSVLLKDPNPLVSGQGLHLLKSRGIEVFCLEEELQAKGLLEKHPSRFLIQEAKKIHSSFLFHMEHRKPLLTLKMASSLDGFIGLKNGDSQWLTSPQTRQVAREMRGFSDALMTGKGTVLQDNPYLDLRQTPFEKKNYPLFVWDSTLSLLDYPHLRIFRERGPGLVTLIADTDRCGIAPGFYQKREKLAYLVLPSKSSHPLSSLYSHWAECSVQSLWVECGASLASYLIENHMLDYCYLFLAPKILGASHGLSWTTDIHIPSLSLAQHLRLEGSQLLHEDLLISASFIKEKI